MDTLTLSNGKIVKYEYQLTDGGANIYLETVLTRLEKKEFKQAVQYDHDVVGLYFLPAWPEHHATNKTRPNPAGFCLDDTWYHFFICAS